MTIPDDPYNFANGTVADADQVDARFAPLYSILSAGLGDDNLMDDGISLGKLRPYVAAMRHSAPTQFIGSDITGEQRIVFNTVVIDERPLGESAQADIANDWLVCRESGIYLVFANYAHQADLDGSRRTQIRHNGTVRFEESSPGTFDAHTVHNVIGVLPMVDGDRVELFIAQSSGEQRQPQAIGYAPFLGMVRVA